MVFGLKSSNAFSFSVQHFELQNIYYCEFTPENVIRMQSLKFLSTCCRVLQCVAVCYSVLQCVAVCCSVLQCVGTVLQSLKFLSTFPRGERHLGKRVLLALQAATIRPAKSHPSTRELDAESDQDCREDGPTLCSRPLSSYHLHSPLRLPPALKDGV